ncbi:Bax inhibitor-1 family protein [Myxococcota bacterium]|nr:Bax inhibitor-1 family protein [Myxococcota bacterium]MBU1432539.1 Bax inhibitor-1 family protein [Myxococcota bacterium]MBU1898678.1 Bax inhibitor-1 family protein [Myxococcota bacterium]
MSYSGYQAHTAAAYAGADARAEFIKKTYLHLGGAVFAFTALTALLINSPVAPAMLKMIAASRFNWLLFLGAFMLFGYLAERWAQGGQSKQMQYVGLGLYVLFEAIIFTPMMYIAAYYTDKSVLPTAGIMTLLTFGGLTATAFLSKTDFSFLGRVLSMAMFAAMGLIICSILFGFNLGTLFSFGMVVIAGGYILYYTSNVLRHYPTDAHVAASLALFAAVALLFWYILRLVMSRD